MSFLDDLEMMRKKYTSISRSRVRLQRITEKYPEYLYEDMAPVIADLYKAESQLHRVVMKLAKNSFPNVDGNESKVVQLSQEEDDEEDEDETDNA